MRRRTFLPSFVGECLRRAAAAAHVCEEEVRSTPTQFGAPKAEIPLLPCCCALVSRSRGLRCCNNSELERVLSSMEKSTTVEAAQVIGIRELGKLGVAKSAADFVRKKIVDYVLNLHSEMLDICWRGRGCVVFFGAAGKDLLVAIATPHDIPEKYAKGIKRVRTLDLLSERTATTTARVEQPPPHKIFEVYCVENGVGIVMRNDSSHERWLLETFLRDTLKFHQIQVVAAVAAPHQVLSPTYFVANRILPRISILKVDGRQRCVAIADDDWSTLTGRVVDYRRGQGEFFSNVLDLKLPQTWAADANVAVLIGGESGSGKTMEMICGHCDKSDLVVYMRGFSGDSDVVKFVKYAFYCSCPCMNDVLKRHTNGDKFTVRLCFDDIDDSAALVRACSLDTTKLRELLGWGPSVEIRVAVAGSGIVAACNGSGINRNLYQLETLSHNESMRKAIVYWKIRRHLIKEALHVHCAGKDLNLGELLCDVEMLEIHWGDRPQREAMLRKRSATLSRLFREQLTSLATKMELSFVSTPLSAPDSILTLLTNEAFFAAVESDSACAVALSNPRMAALIVKEVQNIGQRTLTDEIGVATKGINVRRHVLQRAAHGFNLTSEPGRDTPHQASTQLVEALRYVLFDGYASADGHNARLASFGGILVDNAKYGRDVPKGCVPVLGDDGTPYTMSMSIRSSDSEADAELQSTHIACYPEDLGRYSISPAMMVVLTTLMTGIFEENFSSISDGPERNIAKFLYLAVQVFHGRPAIVGKAAQKILDDNTTIDFQSLTLRICGDVLHFRGAELSSVPSKAPVAALTRTSMKVASCVCKVSRKARGRRVGSCTSCAWIECSPSWLPSADVVFHIPKVITITIQLSEGNDITQLGHGSKAGSLKSMHIKGLQKLLGAPVIAAVLCGCDAFSDGKVNWGGADGITDHCIIASKGAGTKLFF